MPELLVYTAPLCRLQKDTVSRMNDEKKAFPRG